MGRFCGRLLADGFELRGGRLAAIVFAVMFSAPVLAEPPPPPPPASVPSAARVQHAQELVDEALGLYERGEYRAAIAKLEAAVELDPKGAELVYNLGLIHERLGEIELAEGYYRKDLE